MDLRGKKLLLLGGVQPTCQIIEEAHKMGVKVYVTDYLENSPAKKIADKSFMISTTDVDAVVELCKNEKIDGVFTGYTDSMLPYCQKICKKLNLPFWGDERNIDICIDKEKFKIACEKAGVPVVPWKKVNLKNYKEKIQDLSFPVVIKPVDSSGSRGVFKCYHKDEYEKFCEMAFEFSKKKELLIEKLMDMNSEISVYYMIYNGKTFLSEMGDRYVHAVNEESAPVGQGMTCPSRHLQEWQKQMESKIENFFVQNNMKNGFVFFQGFYENGNFYIHEVGYRLCGGFAYKYVEKFSGYNQIQEMIRFSLTGEMNISQLEKSNPLFYSNAFTLTLVLKAGKVKTIIGVEEISELSPIIEFCQLRFEDDSITTEGATTRVFAYILCDIKNRKDLTNLINEVKTKIKVLDEDGNNMLTEILYPEKVQLFYE